ncbi:putative protein phosphatase 2C 72 [Sesamum angolense]|uniref:PPM-type phosphatase domain-containing protein n=1 Tax=Sesamum angolense TaxID=2727404 RepID=A0AAE1W8L8_9LAMI|nr:putative protein phosphatase 2C 72 [Sesamum angolense]
MGICASISSSVMHDDTYGHENAVYYRGTGYGIENGGFGAVFDGHGKNGHIVSKIVRNRLPSLLLSQRNGIAKISPSAVSTKQSERPESDQSGPSKNFLKWKEACVRAFKVMDKEIKLLDSLDCSCSGSTAVVVVKQGEDLVIANLGDSRAVLGTRTENGISAVQLTTDFKPGVHSEAERIRKFKGRVLALKEEPHIQRVWLPYDDSPGLAMSRAFGDFVLKNHGIIAIPDVSYHRLSPNDQFLVLASDGVWDVLSNDEVVSIVSVVSSEEQQQKQWWMLQLLHGNTSFPTQREMIAQLFVSSCKWERHDIQTL